MWDRDVQVTSRRMVWDAALVCGPESCGSALPSSLISHLIWGSRCKSLAHGQIAVP